MYEKEQGYDHLNWKSHQSLKKAEEKVAKIFPHTSPFPLFSFPFSPLPWFMYEKEQDNDHLDWKSHQSLKKVEEEVTKIF